LARRDSRNIAGSTRTPGVVERIAVIGAGTMGAGIAQLACLGGLETWLHDPVPEALSAGEARVAEGLAKGASREMWTASDAGAARERLHLTADMEGLGGCGLAIEAAPEDLALKRELFARLAAICGSDAILATNTSSLSVTAIAAGVERPERVCGMHFFNPPVLMRLVEIVAGDETAPETVEAATEVARAMRREPIRAADAIGFVANRLARPFTLEALRLLGERVAPLEQIDRIVRIGGGFRMGPFELMDLVGVDVNFEVAKSFWEQSFHEPRWQPSPIQARTVAAGRHGKKVGRGYYDYRQGPHRPDDPAPPGAEPGWSRDEALEGSLHYVALPDLETARLVEIARDPSIGDDEAQAAERYFRAAGKHVEWVGDAPGLVLGRILAQIVNEAYFAVGQGVASRKDCDTAMRLGFNWPQGPFELGTALGPGRVVSVLDELRADLGEERYRVAPQLRRAATA
jgi:3-hydroxybutyryl-CoA dehydrogenase